jgi:hypothetical protein
MYGRFSCHLELGIPGSKSESWDLGAEINNYEQTREVLT